MSVANVARQGANRHRLPPRSGTLAHEPAGTSARSAAPNRALCRRLCRASPAAAHKQTRGTLQSAAAPPARDFNLRGTVERLSAASVHPRASGALAWRTVAMVGASAARRIGCCESGPGSSSDAPTIRMLPIESAVPLRKCSSSAATNSSSLSPRKLTCPSADASGPLSCGSPQAARVLPGALCATLSRAARAHRRLTPARDAARVEGLLGVCSKEAAAQEHGPEASRRCRPKRRARTPPRTASARHRVRTPNMPA